MNPTITKNPDMLEVGENGRRRRSKEAGNPSPDWRNLGVFCQCGDGILSL